MTVVEPFDGVRVRTVLRVPVVKSTTVVEYPNSRELFLKKQFNSIVKGRGAKEQRLAVKCAELQRPLLCTSSSKTKSKGR